MGTGGGSSFESTTTDVQPTTTMTTVPKYKVLTREDLADRRGAARWQDNRIDIDILPLSTSHCGR